MRSVTVFLAVLLLVGGLSHDVWALSPQQNIDDYRVLPIKGELPVNVFFYDVDPRWFGVRDFQELYDNILETGIIRSKARSQIAAFSSGENLAPFEFDVKLEFFPVEDPLPMLEEFRQKMRSLVSKTPFQISQKAVEFAVAWGIPLSWTDQTIRARDALRVFADITEKWLSIYAGGYSVFVFCSIPFMGGERPAIYYTFGQSPDTGRYLADFGITIFGGPWWGRYYYIDICSLPPPRFRDVIKPIYLIEPPEERINYLATLLDLIIDMGGFVKSTIYQPKYGLQTLVDVVVIDATVAGVGFDMLVRYFDPELMLKAYTTLMPYNKFNIRLKRVDLATVPELRNALEFTQQGILLKTYKAYDILKQRGYIEEVGQQRYTYMPVIVLITTTNSFIEEPGVLGRASPDPRDPTQPHHASAAVYYEHMIEEGMTVLVTHEAGHIFGLRHPHDDYDEYRQSESSFFPLTYFTETIMSYSKSWISGVEQTLDFPNTYPIRTFYSIFDLDNIDRATIILLLQNYEQNMQTILSTLRQNNINPNDIPELNEVLNSAKTFAKIAVEYFKMHKYFNRLEFKGLGAEVNTAFDAAFSAWLYTENTKNYVLPGLVDEVKRLGGEVSRLTGIREQLRSEVEKAQRELEEARAALEERKRELAGAEEEVRQLEARVSDAETRVANARAAREEVKTLENRLQQLSADVDALDKRLVSLREQNNLFIGVAVVGAVAVAGAAVIGRRFSARRPQLPPPPPPPPSF
ncbi:hypothetical protein CSUB_C0780 [Candidatus Caldarchaeum subterraneum]|uniref:Uncharacterized protein n=1 Tax=Caldiarchaeum subterraneum TaxID=311458 RepID=E6N650_CALS0|nr:hypothetical protein HGMM_F39F10C19 [Candidatus Caldarchaeum subterraneum]BAJ50638.1 hypothetical protein CSUB_C0780 [Candidatus Caldarchaeum subterraneum]